jgi:hypothetical protein
MTEPERHDTGGRPPFAGHYPRTPEIDRLLGAFESGDYATVRSDAPKVAACATDPQVAEAARDLVRRTLPDPIALYLMGLTLALFAVLSIWFFLHQD